MPAKLKIQPISRYKHWLKLTAKAFCLTEKEIKIVSRRCNGYYVSSARLVFYILCFQDGIDIYRLSEHFGKTRTCIIRSMQQQLKIKDVSHIVKQIKTEDYAKKQKRIVYRQKKTISANV